MIGTPLHWSVFLGLVLGLLALDLGVFNRKAHRVGTREALLWVCFWVGIALAFNGWIWFETRQLPAEQTRALEFLTGYLIELALSVDNIFVFIVIFNYFRVPSEYQHRVLFWGILGALVMRGTFVALGTTLIQRFDWIILVFGGFLVYTGFKILRTREPEVHPENNPVLKLFRRFVRMTPDYRGTRFVVREGRVSYVTPLLLVLLVIEATDIVFAVDSIPAIFGITQHPFIVFTSNIFAVLGLRAWYFLLAGVMHKFHYLSAGLGLVLMFVGAKMLAHDWVHVPIGWSLAVVVLLLGGSVVLSLLRPAPPESVPDPLAATIDEAHFSASPAALELAADDGASEAEERSARRL